MNFDETLLENAPRVVVACSGGADSMALLHQAVTRLGAERVVCAHVDHNLRADSGLDRALVEKTCAAYGCVFRLAEAASGAFDGQNVEAAARKFRYRFFHAVATAEGATVVLTAHHALDNAETVLMNVCRGCGLSGAGGIRRRQGIFARPMLDATRVEIAAYVSAHNIPYRDDETNFTDAYTRNFFRLRVIPLIEERLGGAVAAVNRFAAIVREEDAYMDSVSGVPIVHGEEASVLLTDLDVTVLARRTVRKALAAIDALEDIECGHIDDVIGLKHLRNGARMTLPHGLCAIRAYDRITIYRQQVQQSITSDASTGDTGAETEDETAYCVPFERKDAVYAFGVRQKMADQCVVPPKPSLLIDPTAVPQGACWRTRQTGDTFEKFGGGTVKLKDYLIDRKVPVRLRDKLPLLCYNHTVTVIAGLEIAESVRAREGGNFMILEYQGETICIPTSKKSC